jgi:hypothetical protein
MTKHYLKIERNKFTINRGRTRPHIDYLAGACECGEWSKIRVIKSGRGMVANAKGELVHDYQMHAKRGTND